MPPKKKQDAPEAKPEDVKPDEAQAPTDPPPELDDPAPENPQEGADLGDGAEAGNGNTPPTEPDVELVEVTDPCPLCYPDGWPVKEEGASASCFHGVTVVYGKTTVLTAEVVAAVRAAAGDD